MTNSPKVTIGIPTWNRSGYLCEALRSVLAQTYRNIEIVVSDNASTDDTATRLREFTDPRIVLLRQDTNIGGIPNLNVCLNNATGELFVLLSDDDLLEPEAIEKLSRPFRESVHGLRPESVGITWCPCWIVDSNGNHLWQTEEGPTAETSVSMMKALFHGKRGPRFAGVMLRTSDARSVGGYNEPRHGAICDTGNWGQVALRYDNVACIQQPLVKYRVHESSHTSRSVCSDWQAWGAVMHADLLATLRARGDSKGERQLVRTRKNLLANLTIDVLLRGKGKPHWIQSSLQEVWRSRSFMLTPYMAKRAMRDGWKLVS